jgi:hypothetical protein
VKSLLDDVLTPSITQFLDTVQKNMNGFPLLFKVQADVPINKPDSFDTDPFLQLASSQLFVDMWFEYDAKRKWYYYHEWDESGAIPIKGTPVKEKTNIKSRHISILGFLDKLYWALMLSLSPYHTRDTSEEQGRQMVIDFASEILELDPDVFTKPKNWVGLPGWIEQPWTFYDIQPDFLHTAGYWERKDPADDPPRSDGLKRFYYFESGCSDSCTYFYKDDIFYVLLTTGSP